MAYDAKTRARARRLYEYDGKSLDHIAQVLKVTVRCLEKWKKAEGWERFSRSGEVQEKERQTVLALAAESGITIARHLKELAAVGYSDHEHYVTVGEDGKVSTKPWSEVNKQHPGASRAVKKIKQRTVTRLATDKSGAKIEESTFEFELHDKGPVLREITDILGIKKAEVEKEKENDTLLNLIRSMRPR